MLEEKKRVAAGDLIMFCVYIMIVLSVYAFFRFFWALCTQNCVPISYRTYALELNMSQSNQKVDKEHLNNFGLLTLFWAFLLHIKCGF